MPDRNDNTNDKPSLGERIKEAAHGHLTEALQGNTHAPPERKDPERELAEAEVERRTHVEGQRGHDRSRTGGSDAYGGGLAGAGAATALDAGLGAGAGGAAAEYHAASEPPREAGGRNDSEFAGYGGAGGPADSVHPEGTGPAPDHTQTGPGSGIPSGGLQRLP